MQKIGEAELKLKITTWGINFSWKIRWFPETLEESKH